jgi:hypothetical protein
MPWRRIQNQEERDALEAVGIGVTSLYAKLDGFPPGVDGALCDRRGTVPLATPYAPGLSSREEYDEWRR